MPVAIHRTACTAVSTALYSILHCNYGVEMNRQPQSLILCALGVIKTHCISRMYAITHGTEGIMAESCPSVYARGHDLP